MQVIVYIKLVRSVHGSSRVVNLLVGERAMGFVKEKASSIFPFFGIDDAVSHRRKEGVPLVAS